MKPKGDVTERWEGSDVTKVVSDTRELMRVLCSFDLRVLLVNREESRPAEWMARKFFGALSAAFPTAMSIPISAVARAMLINSLIEGGRKTEILENKAIYNLGKVAEKP